MKPLSLADKLYWKHIPDNLSNKRVLVVGSGECRMDYHMIQSGYDVYSTDYNDMASNNHSGYHPIFLQELTPVKNQLKYYDTCNLFDLNTFPDINPSLVICSQMLEHQPNWVQGVKNLIELASEFVIITVPRQRSFFMHGPPPQGHCNFWSETDEMENGLLYSLGLKLLNHIM